MIASAFLGAFTLSHPPHIAAMLADTKPRKDARIAATAASKAIIQEHLDLAPEDIGLSLCYPSTPLDKDLRIGAMPLKLFEFLGFFMFLALVLFAILFAVYAWFDRSNMELVIRLGCAIPMLMFLSISIGITLHLAHHALPWRLRENVIRMLPQRSFAPFEATAGLPSHALVIDDPACRTMYLFPQDAALLVIDAELSRVIIEGVAYRYIIHAPDFVSLTLAPRGAIEGHVRAQLTYNIAGQPVVLHLWFQEFLSPNPPITPEALSENIRQALNPQQDARQPFE
jgi:hypothetical protein